MSGSPAPAAQLELSAELHELSLRYRERPVPLGEIFDTLGPRASALLVVICALPFSTPISLPGLSTPFGLVILVLALRYLLGKPPWLPESLRRVMLPGAFLTGSTPHHHETRTLHLSHPSQPGFPAGQPGPLPVVRP
jgi:hypothetical protein